MPAFAVEEEEDAGKRISVDNSFFYFNRLAASGASSIRHRRDDLGASPCAVHVGFCGFQPSCGLNMSSNWCRSLDVFQVASTTNERHTTHAMSIRVRKPTPVL